MVTKPYFNHFNNTNEQRLAEDLTVEYIKHVGIDCYYLPRTLDNKDEIFKESSIQSFNDAFIIDMLVRDVNGFRGDGNFLSKFGLEIRDEITMSIARRIFEEDVGTQNGQTRPNEGDLIYFPLNKKVFQIKFVDHESTFYQFGALQFYDCICELFEWSNEIFNTGIEEIDDKYNAYSTNAFDYTLHTESGQLLLTEDGDVISLEEYDLKNIDIESENDDMEEKSLDILDWSETNPFGEEAETHA